jgi:hypothetical protein
VRNALPDDPAVSFDLFLPSTFEADPPFLAGKVGPHPGQAGQQVLVLGQIDLGARLRRLGPLGENVQDQRRSVEHFHPVQGLVYVADLRGAKVIVKNDQVGLRLVERGFDFCQLTRTHVGGVDGLVQLLNKATHRLSSGRFGQEGQFVKVLFGLVKLYVFGAHPHEDGPLRLLAGNDLCSFDH